MTIPTALPVDLSENNLMAQIEYLTKNLCSQLGINDTVFNGTADEATMLNYNNRTNTITQSEGNIIKEKTKMNESKLESDFDHIVEGQLQRCRDILVKKGDEYATDSDRLHNFRVASEITGQTMEQALAGMMVKHTTSVYDMIYSGKTYSKALWDEKITDHMVYLLLLQAVLDHHRPEAV